MFIHIPKTAGTAIIKRLGLVIDSHKRVVDYDGKSGFWTVVRNPYDRIISMAAYTLRKPGLTCEDIKQWFTGKHENLKTYDYPITLPQFEYTNIGGKNVCECLRFENLAGDIKNKYDVKLEFVNFSRRGNYKEYYDNELKEIVFNFYKDDFKQFNYSKEL